MGDASVKPKIAPNGEETQWNSTDNANIVFKKKSESFKDRFLIYSTPIFWFLSKSSIYTPIPLIQIPLLHVIICIFAFFYYLRPSEPFLVEYLVSGRSTKEFEVTVELLVEKVFPLWTYSYPFFQLFIGLISDTIVPLKFVIILGLFAAIISALLVIIPYETLLLVQLSQFTISLSISCHQAYFALIYHSAKRNDYQKLTSYSRFFYLFGNVVGSVFGQLWWIFFCQPSSLTSRLMYLFIFTMFFSAICIFITYLFFPHNASEYFPEDLKELSSSATLDEDQNVKGAVDRSIKKLKQFSNTKEKRRSENDAHLSPQELESILSGSQTISSMNAETLSIPSINTDQTQLLSNPSVASKVKYWKYFSFPIARKIYGFLKQILHSYTVFNVIFWSVYNIAAVAIHQLAITYYQTLFKKLYPNLTYNGFMIAFAYILAAFCTLLPSRLSRLFLNQEIPQFIALVLLCIMAFLLFLLSQSVHFLQWISPIVCLVFAYTVFIIYHCMFEFLHVVAAAQIAASMKYLHFTAIFSLNSIVQNLFQAFIQVVLTNVTHLIDVFKQYLAFGALLLLLSLVLYTMLGIATLKRNFKQYTLF